MVDIKAIETALDHDSFMCSACDEAMTDGLPMCEQHQAIADLLATVRELREALGALLESRSASKPCMSAGNNDREYCLAHIGEFPYDDGECPVTRARRLVNG